MFKNLFDFSAKRNGWNALGFYIVYVLAGGVLCGLASAFMAAWYCVYEPQACSDGGAETGYKIGRLWGPIIGFLFTLFMGCAVVSGKKLWNSVPSVLLYIASVLSAWPFGVIIAFIFVAIISTFDNVNSQKIEDRNGEENPPLE